MGNGLAALSFNLQAANTLESIARELRAWHDTGLRIAIWGGAGESAAFLQTHGLDANRFPLVVDSDQPVPSPLSPAPAKPSAPPTGCSRIPSTSS